MSRPGRFVLALVVCSAVVRTLLAHRIAAPWIMVDELIYSELAKSFAAHGRFEIRGVTATGYGFVYPVLIAPAWRTFHAVGTAYRVAQAMDAVVMSLAAVPAFFLARRVVGAAGARAVALLTVLVPSMLYTGTLMTENVFYPLFLVVVLVLVATLLRPTPLREVALLALLVLAFETRQQAVALVPACALAPVLYGAVGGELRRALRRWAPFYGLGAAALVVGAAAAWAAGSSPLAALGAYRAATSAAYTSTSVARYVLWHTAELDLYLGAAPFAALVLVWLLARRQPPELRAFAAATLPITVFLVVEVAAFASTHAMRIEERNLFYVAPLAFVALAAVVGRAAAFDARAAAAAVALTAALPATIPLARFVNRSATPDTFALLPWWSLHDHGAGYGTLRVVAGIASLAAAALVLVPRRLLLLPVAVVAVYLVAASAVAYEGRHGIVDAARGTLHAGIRGPRNAWVDSAVGHTATVAEIYDGTLPIQSVWETEFFNRSVGPVLTTATPYPDGLPVTELRERGDGTLVTAAGAPYLASLALVPPSLSVDGTTIAHDTDGGLQLVRVRGGRLVVLTTLTGLYPGDVWSGKTVTYTHRRCTGGTVALALATDPSLYTHVQHVTVAPSGGSVRRVAIEPDATAHLRVALHPTPRHTCVLRLSAATLRIPAEVERGSTDARPLGVRLLALTYER